MTQDVVVNFHRVSAETTRSIDPLFLGAVDVRKQSTATSAQKTPIKKISLDFTHTQQIYGYSYLKRLKKKVEKNPKTKKLNFKDNYPKTRLS